MSNPAEEVAVDGDGRMHIVLAPPTITRHEPMICGGISQAYPATPEGQAVADKVRGAVETRLGSPVKEFVVETQKTQVVAGTNYVFRIRIDKDKYVHIRVFEPLHCHNKPPELTGLVKDKVGADELGDVPYFSEN